MNDFINRSFFFIPFSTEKDLKSISDALDKSGIWTAVDNGNVCYLMKYVAARIKDSYDKDTICIQRKLDLTDENAVPAEVSEIFGAGNRKKELTGIGREMRLGFVLGDVFLFCFDTGICFLAIGIEYAESDYIKISDNLFNLKNVTRKYITVPASDSGKKRRVSLIDISKTILFSENLLKDGEFHLIRKTAVEDAQQISVISYIETDYSENELQKLLFYMGHCYYQGYECLEDTDDALKTYKNNSVCTWGVTSESAVCASFPTEKQENFINEVFRKKFSSGYLLMYVLLLHQKYKLYDLIEKVGSNSADGEESLKKIRTEFYTFERNYNFRIISGTAQYQNVYWAIYEANQIDRLMDDVKEPLEAINSILDEEKHKREEAEAKREAEDDKKTGNALAILSILTIFSTLFDAWEFIRKIPDMIMRDEPFLRNVPSIIVSLLIIAFFGFFGKELFSTIIRSRKDRKNQKQDDKTESP